MPEDPPVKLHPQLAALAMEALAEGVVLLDAEGRIEYVNRAFAEGLGLPTEDIVGRLWTDEVLRVTDREGRPIPDERRPLRQVLETGQPVLGYEYDVYSVDGRRINVDVNAVPLMEDGHVTGAAVTFTDVTRRTHTENALRESEMRLRAFVDQARHGFFIASVSGETLLYNRAMEEITGNPADEVRERGWLETAFPEPVERERFLRKVTDSLASDEPYLEAPYTRRDGRHVWLSYAVSVVKLHGKDYSAGIVTDITQRKAAEERARFQSTLLEQVRNAVLATDVTSRVIYANSEAGKLFGRRAEDLLGMQVTDLLAAPPGRTPDDIAAEAVQRGRWEGEAAVVTSSGAQIPVLLAFGALLDDGGSPYGYVGVISDIREMKRAQRELEEKDRAIRQAYVEVVGAVTGGKLVLMTREELDESLGRPLLASEAIRYDTLSESRRRVREIMRHEATAADPSEAVVAYGEAANNALKHAGGGHAGVYRNDGTLQVLVTDDGTGIDFQMLPHATLTAGFSTKQTLGIGFTIMLDLADRMLLSTQPGCTKVVLEFALKQGGSDEG